MKTLRAILSSFSRSPVKLTLTLLTVGLGVGVLIFALSISSAFSRLFSEQLERDGIVVMVSNAQISEDTGMMEPVRPSQFDSQALDVLSKGIQGVQAASPVDNRGFNELAAGEGVYRIRSVISADAGYASVMGLKLVAGEYFTASEVESGAKKALITESLAKIVFGSAERAVGQTMKPPAPAMPAASTTASTGGQNAAPQPRVFVIPTYTVSGVFADVSELARTSYGVGDMVIPYTASFSQGSNTEMARRLAMSTIALRVKGSGLATIEAQARAALAAQYGEDVSVMVWEGAPRGETATLEEARSTVSAFSLVVNLLGFILLVTGSIGILSIMLVEVLGKHRQIAIERALGASGRIIMREYFTRSLALSALSAAVGVILAVALAGPLKALVLPIFNGVSAADLGSNVITPLAVGIGVASALLVGGVFGVFPVLPALRANIAEGMREA
jgi:putative ABC transport system permease protein